jgi:exo-1,4-beta-D-glucosaminidase
MRIPPGPAPWNCFILAVLACCLLAQSAAPEADRATRFYLRAGWAIQSSASVSQTGEILSTSGFKPDGWHPATMPSTVVAALVADKTYPDPYFGKNLRSIPGTTYPIGVNFWDLPMPADSPFRASWWYRTEFHLPADYDGRTIWLHFHGINYRANIWLNGRKLADASEVAGTYRRYEFNVTSLVLPGQANALAVEVFAQTEKDLGVNFQDWNPAPPDKDMGLWDDVYLTASGAVGLRYPQVITHFPDASLKRADLTVMAELHNASEQPVTAVVDGTIEELRFSQSVGLAPGETRSIRFEPQEFPQLSVRDPKLWWPAPLGPQNLHALSLRVSLNGEVSDEQSVHFGIREFTSELTDKGYRLFRVNGGKILIRGGGWAQDMLLRPSEERLEAQIRYVRGMGLNTIRLEGQLETDDFFELTDKEGILVMPGWVCCTFWQQWEKWQPADLPIAAESLRSQSLRLRSHPSVFVWLNGSDVPPTEKVEQAYINVLKETAWPNPYLSSASATPTSITGPSGVKMSGPYDYVPPSYWLLDSWRYGGAYGFNTETSPGQAIPPVESLRQMIPAEHLWPIDDFWNYHAGSESFQNLDHYNQAMNAMYGAPSGLGDYVTKSQTMAYDGERAMFEAYARNKYDSTGVIQWMLNNAWPSLIWHLYDYYLQPAGGYFGTRKACEPLHVQYSYDDRSVVVVNSFYREASGLTVTAKLYDFDLHEKFSRQVPLSVGPDGVQRALTLPALPSSSAAEVYFLKLVLQNSAGEVLSSNFYWLPSHAAAPAWRDTIFFGDGETSIYTPVSSYDDLTELNRLPKVRLAASAVSQSEKEGAAVRVQLQNRSAHLAFQVHLGICKKGEKKEVLPVLWDDNYFELMPGESRTLTARFPSLESRGDGLELIVDGWNIEPARLEVRAEPATGKPSARSVYSIEENP